MTTRNGRGREPAAASAPLLHDPATERLAVGRAAFDPGIRADLLARLVDADFFVDAHRVLFGAVRTMALGEAGADLVALADRVESSADVFEKLGGVATFVRDLQSDPEVRSSRDWPADVFLDATATPLRRLAIQRRIANTARALAATPSDAKLVAALAEMQAQLDAGSTSARALAPPDRWSDLLRLPPPQEVWIASELIPAEANVLVAAYPKSHKTNLCIDLAVAAASGTPFLGHYAVPRQHRVGIVLMEGAKHQLVRRTMRIAQARGVEDLGDLDDFLHPWFRPKLSLASPAVMTEMAAYVSRLQLDLLVIDNWSYVASGNSNDSDEVTPQLKALSDLREASPGLTVVLVHHARKSGGADKSGERLADMIRNSTAFPAWYDVGIAAARKDETSPVVDLRIEMRDYPTPPAFSFIVEDEHPASPEYGPYPGGWLRLRVHGQKSDRAVAVAVLEGLFPAIADVLASFPGCTSRGLRQHVKGNNERIDDAVALMVERGLVLCDVNVRGSKSYKLVGPPPAAPSLL
jgi:hypothetical protein